MKETIVSGASPYLMPAEDPAGKIVFAVIFFVIILVCFVALITFMAAVLRGQTERARSAIHDAPIATMAYGIVGWLVFGLAAAWLYSQAFIERLLESEIVPGFLIGAVVVLLVPMCLSLLGAPGLFSCIGDRIAALRGHETSSLRRSVSGTLVSVFAALFPIVGWFLILPLLVASAFGAGARSLFR
jgi:uncharacterized protein YacL